MPKGVAVESMFSSIAVRYDRANHVISGGVDYYWRYQLAQAVKSCNPKKVVDLATGSGDVAFTLAKHLHCDVSILGLDFCENMLREARTKNSKYSNVQFNFGDCLSLPLKDASIDAITISFGLRNLEDRQRGLLEINRVLKPGGHLFILEFSQPDNWIKPFYYLYLKRLLPTLAYWTTRNKNAYQYLADSIEKFPTRQALTAQLLRSGFQRVRSRRMTFGIVALHHAKCF